MAIGLCGAHGTGKTTLAKAYADQIGVPFVEGRVSAVFKAMGLDSGDAWGKLSMTQRLDVQERVLAEHVSLYREYGESAFITDRTPIDFLAYTLANLRQDELTPELEARIERYTERCLDEVNANFTLLVALQPCAAIPLVAREGRGELSAAFISVVNSLVLGLARDERIITRSFVVARRMHKLQDRVSALAKAAKVVAQEHIQVVSDLEPGPMVSTLIH